MEVNRINTNTHFKGIWNNEKVLKGLEKISDHSASFNVGLSFLMAVTVKPLVIKATPKAKKENKDFASTHSIISGVTKLALAEMVAIPIENAVKKIDENPTQYLKKETIEKLKGQAKNLNESDSYKYLTQIIKLGSNLISAIPKAMIVAGLMGLIAKKTKQKKQKENNIIENKSKQIPFTGKISDKIPKLIGSFMNNKTVQNFATKNQSGLKNIARNMSIITDSVLTGAFVLGIKKNKNIEEKKKRPLMYNSIFSTGFSILSGVALDGLIKKGTNKAIENLKKAQPNNPKLSKYIQGINILRPAVIFAGIYYGILPFVSTFLADKTDEVVNKNKTIQDS